jgi:hypothetical protein
VVAFAEAVVAELALGVDNVEGRPGVVVDAGGGPELDQDDPAAQVGGGEGGELRHPVAPSNPGR